MKNITGYDFTDDMNKMHDFMLLNKDEFLSSYSYLKWHPHDSAHLADDLFKILEKPHKTPLFL